MGCAGRRGRRPLRVRCAGRRGRRPLWMGYAGRRGRRPLRSEIEVHHILRVGLNELLSRLYLFAHEDGEGGVGGQGVAQGDTAEGPGLGVHGGLPELVGVHLAQAGTGKSGSYGMWNHPRGHVWNVFVRPASS